MTPLHRLRVSLGKAFILGGGALRMLRHGAEMRSVETSGGLRFPYMRVGRPVRGRIVWLHGFGDHPLTFLPSAVALANDYEVIAPAMPGFAGPRPAGEKYTLDAYGRWLSDFLDALDLRNVHLAGNSLGGATAAGVALLRPERIETLSLVDNAGVLTSTPESLSHEIDRGEIIFEVRTREDYARFVGRVYHRAPPLPAVARDFLFEDVRGRADWFRRLILEMQGGLNASDPEHPGWLHHRLDQIRTPTQVVWGEQDSFFPVAHAELTASRIPGSELHVMPDTGHCPHVERPEELAAILRRFVQSPR